MLILTSIPPVMSRLDADREIGSEYQLACIDSWIDAGFEPVSVNATCENLPPAAVSRVRSTRLVRDSQSITGKPQIFFSDLIDVAVKESRGEPFAVTNADILLGSVHDLVTMVSRLRPREFLFSRRIDIESWDQRAGTHWESGYDFFAAHPEDAAKLKRSELVFGAPWWDHYFPLAMLGLGCRIQQITCPIAFHLKHKRNWGGEEFEALGNVFLAETDACDLPPAYRCRSYAALAPPKLSWAELKRIIRRRPRSTWRETLSRVITVNIRFIDEWSMPVVSDSHA
jgi:hypothetical protein